MSSETVKEKIDKIERIIGYKVPNYFRKFYMENNESKVNNLKFMTIDEILDEVLSQNDDYEEIYEDLTSIPEHSIRKVVYSTSRLPILCDYSGNYIGIDFKPDTNGKIGQIINYGGDEFEMYVFANTFQDFVEGINNINFSNSSDNSMYIEDYLISNNINFITNHANDEISKITENITQDINFTEETITEEIINIKFSQEFLNVFFKEIQKLKDELKNDINIIKLTIISEDYRIKNFRDSLSRTMQSENNFWDKLKDYPQEQIKGFSMFFYFKLSEVNENMKKTGTEKIFIDTTEKSITVRLKTTTKNKHIYNTYMSIIDYLKQHI